MENKNANEILLYAKKVLSLRIKRNQYRLAVGLLFVYYCCRLFFLELQDWDPSITHGEHVIIAIITSTPNDMHNSLKTFEPIV